MKNAWGYSAVYSHASLRNPQTTWHQRHLTHEKKCQKKTFEKWRTELKAVLRNTFPSMSEDQLAQTVETAITKKCGSCVLSGAASHFRLANGDYLWAEYFFEYIQTGRVDRNLNYVDPKNPHRN